MNILIGLVFVFFSFIVVEISTYDSSVMISLTDGTKVSATVTEFGNKSYYIMTDFKVSEYMKDRVLSTFYIVDKIQNIAYSLQRLCLVSSKINISYKSISGKNCKL